MDRSGFKNHLRELVAEAKDVFCDEIIAKLPERAKELGLKKSSNANISTAQRYQYWYSKILPVLRQTAPDRLEEFTAQYQPDPRRKNLSILSYRLQDYMQGFSTTENPSINLFSSLFQHQITIAEAVLETFDQRLTNIEAIVQADLFRHELDTADEFVSKGHLRPAGALAGVTLEEHLRKLCNDRGIRIAKKAPSISDYNEKLKEGGFIDIPTWRLIQRLGDIRNLSVHAKNREPTKDEVIDLISGTRKLISELI